MASRAWPRDSVPLLNHTPYNIYKMACRYLVHDWLKGRIGAGSPTNCTIREAISNACGLDKTEKWEKENEDGSKKETITGYSRRQVYTATSLNTTKIDMTDDVKQVYEQLLKMNATNHLKTATTHRMWISLTHQFFEMVGVEFTGDMGEMIRIHDLSKYTHSEILGYSVMFGGMQTNWRQLTEQEEKDEWTLALRHHYGHNPHHPEYYYNRMEDDRVDSTGTVSVIDAVNGELHLDEGIIDMLASKAERTMRDDPEISVSKLMDISEVYMKRYAPRDREYVMDRLHKWQEMAHEFIASVENEDRLKNFFLDSDKCGMMKT